MTEIEETKKETTVQQVMLEMLEIRKHTKRNASLIHCITNPISIHDCANIILATGARPIMAEHPKEVEEITEVASTLMLNLGNITDARMESMKRSLDVANRKKIPVLIDLVGVTCSKLRRDFARQLFTEGTFSVIKGNISEILAVANLPFHGTGIDAGAQDAISSENEALYCKIAKELAAHLGCAVMATGKQDLIADKDSVFLVSNGHEALSGITGTGCMVGALTAAYLPASVALAFAGTPAALLAAITMGISGEHAASGSRGPGNFQAALLDEVFCMTDSQLQNQAQIRRIG